MNKVKILLASALMALLIPATALAETWDHSGTGTSGGGGGLGGGSWDGNDSPGTNTNTVYGVRVTFVNADGSRTKITVNGRNIYSNSIDLYGNRSSAGVNRVSGNAKHSVCYKPDGGKTYCAKTDLTGSLTTESGGYSWRNASDFGISFGNFITGNGPVPSTSFKTIEREPWKAKKLFEACFGVTYDDAYKKAGAQCQTNKQNLERSYIIYEPLTSAFGTNAGNSLVATGSELAQSFAYVWPTDLHYMVLPRMGNAVYVDQSSCDRTKFSNCNLGLWRITPISQKLYNGNSRDYFDNTARQNWLGYFVGILRSPLPPTGEQWLCNVTDYTVDAACVDCKDEDGSENRASYIVQDTTSWEGILRSDNNEYMCETASGVQKSNVKNYYLKNTSCGKIYCREEVRVVFPNSKNTLTVDRGRYFTVHSPFRDKDKNVIKPYDPTYNESVAILNETKYDHNWGAIKIQKIKECRMANASNEQSCLNANSDSLSFKKTPNVELTYKGTGEKSEYDDALTNLKLDVEPSGEYGSGTTSSRKVEKSSYSNADGNLKSNYIYRNVQTSTYKLPGTTFRYVLKEGGVFASKVPEGSAYIDLGIAAIPVSPKNKVFTDADATLSLRFKLDDNMHLYKSFKAANDYLPSCSTNGSAEVSNIYKYVTSKASLSSKGVSGVEAKRVNELATSACAKLYQCSQTGSGMTCKKSGVDKCIKNRTNNKLGNTDSTNCFTLNNKDNNGNSNYICPISVEPGVPGVPDVPPIDCPGCKVDPTPPDKEDCVKLVPGTDICIPPTGYNKLIYRTIDLDDNAFPGRNGSGRYTGLNWCGYDYTLEKWNCKWDSNNPVVEEYIYNNRGVEGSSVYNLTPMYTVKLNRNTIASIRSYNNGKTYDDFKLTCEINGQECKSRFVGQRASINCASPSDTCAGG